MTESRGVLTWEGLRTLVIYNVPNTGSPLQITTAKCSLLHWFSPWFWLSQSDSIPPKLTRFPWAYYSPTTIRVPMYDEESSEFAVRPAWDRIPISPVMFNHPINCIKNNQARRPATRHPDESNDVPLGSRVCLPCCAPSSFRRHTVNSWSKESMCGKSGSGSQLYLEEFFRHSQIRLRGCPLRPSKFRVYHHSNTCGRFCSWVA